MRKKEHRPRHSAAEYFVAFLGLAVIALVVAIIATSKSCGFEPSPEIGVRPSQPTPTPTK